MYQMKKINQIGRFKVLVYFFSIVVILCLHLGFPLYGENPTLIEMDQDGNCDEVKFEKFSSGQSLRIIINIDPAIVLRRIEELNRVGGQSSQKDGSEGDKKDVQKKASKGDPKDVQKDVSDDKPFPIDLNRYEIKYIEKKNAVRFRVKDRNKTKEFFYYFVVEYSGADREIKSANFYKGMALSEISAVKAEAERLPEIPKGPLFSVEFRFFFKEAGKKYTIVIKRYNTIQEKLKQSGAFNIYKGEFYTYHKFNVGLHAGLFFPFPKSDSFGLGYENSNNEDDQKAFVTVGREWNPKVIFFVSLYPGNFRPEKSICSESLLDRISLNVGTELSSSVFKKLYVGLGYDLRYFSVSFFYSYGKEDVLVGGYSDGTTIENPNITMVPLRKKAVGRCGVALSFPIDIATGLLGKLLGI